MNAQPQAFEALPRLISAGVLPKDIGHAATQDRPAPPQRNVQITRMLSAQARRSLRAGKLYDRHGAALHVVTSMLANDPRQADTLVVDAITSQVTAATGALPNRTAVLRELAASAFVTWSHRPGSAATSPPAPSSPTLRAVHRLPDDDRAALALCSFGSHTHTQAAKALGLSPANVSTLLREALLILGGPLGLADLS